MSDNTCQPTSCNLNFKKNMDIINAGMFFIYREIVNSRHNLSQPLITLFYFIETSARASLRPIN